MTRSSLARNRVVLAGIATLGAITLTGWLTSPAWSAEKVVEGIVSNGALLWPEYVSEQFGWFKKDGVDLEMVSAGSNVAQELAAGGINLGESGFPDFMRATNQGAPVKIVINGTRTPPYAFYAKPSIKTIADLKGKTVAIGGPKDITLVYTQAFIASAGLKPADLDFIYAKATQDRFAALSAGGVDAAILYPPSTFRAAAQGFTNLGDVERVLKDFPFTVTAVNVNWAQKHRGALLTFVKDYAKAVRWIYDPKNKDEAVKILMKYSNAEPKDASDTYDYFVTKLQAFSRSGAVDPANFKKMSDALVSMGDLSTPVPPMSTFVDASYVDAAWK